MVHWEKGKELRNGQFIIEEILLDFGQNQGDQTSVVRVSNLSKACSDTILSES